jgi:hypothetical protein
MKYAAELFRNAERSEMKIDHRAGALAEGVSLYRNDCVQAGEDRSQETKKGARSGSKPSLWQKMRNGSPVE